MKITFNQTEKIQNSKANEFCEICFAEDPDLDEDGYTKCCNELSLNKKEAIIIAKSRDICDSLRQTGKAVSSNGLPPNIEFRVDNIKFTLNLESLGYEEISKIEAILKI